MKKSYNSLVDSTADKIKNYIKQNPDLQTGSRIPNEETLSKMFNVSRTSVREAVKLLTAANILEIRRGVGTFIKDSSGVSSSLFDLVYLSDKKQDLSDSLTIRYILEPEIARLAAINASEADLENIQKFEILCRERIEQQQLFDDLDSKFHEAVAIASHNLMFVHLTPLLHQSISIINRSATDELVIKAFRDNATIYHKKITDCIINRDTEGAYLHSKFHVYNAIKLVGAKVPPTTTNSFLGN